MNLTYKVKEILRIKLSFILLLFKFCVLAQCQDEKLISEINNKLQKLNVEKQHLKKEIPNIEKYNLKTEIYSELSDYSKNGVKLYNNYIKSLQKENINKFQTLEQLTARENLKAYFEQPDIKEIYKIVKEKYWNSERHSQLINMFKMSLEVKFTDKDKAEYAILQKELNLPSEILDYLRMLSNFDGSYNFYYTTMSMFNTQVKKNRNEINSLLNKLSTSNKNEGNKNIQKETDCFIEKSRRELTGSGLTGTYLTLRYYHNIKLFSDCMQSPEKSEIIKKCLQDSKLMRKAVVDLIIGSRRSRDVGQLLRKLNNELDYDNFEKYWPKLQEISKELPKEVFPDMNEEELEKYPVAVKDEAKMEAECFLECFFVPTLVFD